MVNSDIGTKPDFMGNLSVARGPHRSLSSMNQHVTPVEANRVGMEKTIQIKNCPKGPRGDHLLQWIICWQESPRRKTLVRSGMTRAVPVTKRCAEERLLVIMGASGAIVELHRAAGPTSRRYAPGTHPSVVVVLANHQPKSKY